MSRDLGFTALSGVTEATNPPDDSGSLAADSRVVAFWTLASRLTGFGRVLVLAAVLGPTFFGNLFQTALFVPYVICELLAGTFIPALLAPRLVHALDRGDRAAANRLATGFLGVLLPVFLAVTLLGVAVAPGLLWLLTIAVDDPGVRAKQIALGWPLLAALLPQVILYAVVGTGIAVQHAHRRFAFATAAPLIENVGMVAVLGISAAAFGIGKDVEHIQLLQVLTLGLGSTAVVGLHAAAQWWGAARLGIRLLPSAGWHDPGVRRIIRMAIPSSASAGLNSIGVLAILAASGQIPGGAVAFQIGQYLYNLPISLCARPIATAQLPLLSRHFGRSASTEFQATYRQSLRLAVFIALPASLLFLGMPNLLAAAVSLGEMSNPAAISLIAAVLAGISIGVVGEVVFVVSMSAAYARHDATSPLRATVLRVLIYLVGIAASLNAAGEAAQLLWLGATYSVAAIVAAVYLRFRLGDGILPILSRGSASWLVVNSAVTVAATAPAILIAHSLGVTADSYDQRIFGAGVLVLLSGALYLLIQLARGSRELKALFSLTDAALVSAPGALGTDGNSVGGAK